MKKLIHGSTFSGIGAPEVAAEMLGWENAFHCEINPFGRAVLDYYFPNAKSYEDITKTDFSEWRGKIDVLTGGFPCQPFSYAGKRRGSEDDRYLWPYMLKCIEQVRPTWFVGENVAGIRTMVFPGQEVEVASDGDIFQEGHIYRKEEGYVLHEICESLGRTGYSVQPFIVPACAVGAPHRRDRVFIIAHRMAKLVADSDCGDNAAGITGINEGEGREERIPERNAVWEPIEPNSVRCEVERDVPDPIGKRLERKNQSRCGEGRERMQVWGNPAGCGGEDMQFNRDAPHSDSRRMEGLGYHPEECHQGNNGQSSESAFSQVLWDREGLRYLLPENRWRAFPTQSPIYRGNDGIPFDVDNLTISFGKWKKESLKAYGNAIVPQVMYEIFRGIDIIENNNQSKNQQW